ncbi:membrane protein insertase YidC [Candidatus Nomurabacteria bacterium]|nr:membrane protein insertase YidC [Candidatus Nomurabacteria bacterium]
MSLLWNTIFYQPVYNILIFIINNITFGDVGFAIIIITIIIKFILYPLTKKSIRSQILMKKMEPEIKQIKKDFPNKEEQAKKTFELYKKYGTNPFSGCLVVLFQLPVIFALYYVIYKGLSLDVGPIYSFLSKPTVIHTNFLGVIEMGGKSIVLAILAGATQFIQGYLSSPIRPKVEVLKAGAEPEKSSFQDELSNSMQTNVKYILPIFIAFISWKISAAVALYFVISNIFTIVQEWYIRRTIDNK